ncbi:hypothetical protein [Ruminococcus flavefaciens]|uniref:hypothetical protein n=1 Tax=Ruminococcus flavefaciens TaxID=1265 RepID=UPI0026EF00DB|nr:hypothetical protein [Ruminococcus flavefaciens]
MLQKIIEWIRKAFSDGGNIFFFSHNNTVTTSSLEIKHSKNNDEESLSPPHDNNYKRKKGDEDKNYPYNPIDFYLVILVILFSILSLALVTIVAIS